jgi:hypothetical protein
VPLNPVCGAISLRPILLPYRHAFIILLAASMLYVFISLNNLLYKYVCAQAEVGGVDAREEG